MAAPRDTLCAWYNLRDMQEISRLQCSISRRLKNPNTNKRVQAGCFGEMPIQLRGQKKPLSDRRSLRSPCPIACPCHIGLNFVTLLSGSGGNNGFVGGPKDKALVRQAMGIITITFCAFLRRAQSRHEVLDSTQIRKCHKRVAVGVPEAMWWSTVWHLVSSIRLHQPQP
jgi:hypothetical protein